MKHSLTLVIIFLACATSPGATLQLIQTIPIDGVEGRIDHMAIDIDGQRLFIAALGNNTIEIVDLRAGKRIRSPTGFRELLGIARIPERGHFFVASGARTSLFVPELNRLYLAVPHRGNQPAEVRVYETTGN